jgi:predicted lactoylglutathione lyase
MLDRTRIVSRDLAAARRFYAATARSLGLAIIEAEEDSFTLGRLTDMSTPVLWVKSTPDRTQADESETQPALVSLEVSDDYSVRAFYRAALEAGGRQIGYPAPQPTQGGWSYYAARVEDPDGNCIECGWRH